MDGRENRQHCEAGETLCEMCEVQARGTKKQREDTPQLDVITVDDLQRRWLEQNWGVKERVTEIKQFVVSLLL
jgi:hypothetical protein